MWPTRRIVSMFSVLCVTMGVSGTWAGPLASTTFDGRTVTTTLVSGDTATNLNWTVDGVMDPGSMAARRQGGAGQVLFDGTTLTQNSFVPGLNVGNGNTFWWTDVSIIVAPGASVTITNVTFDYLAVSGAQVINVPRSSDYSFALYAPGFDRSTLADWPPNGQPGSPLGEVFLDNIRNPTTDPVTDVQANFASPIELTLIGTYTLRIVGAEAPETGNHTGIDNLSINGTTGGPQVAGSVLLVR